MRFALRPACGPQDLVGGFLGSTVGLKHAQFDDAASDRPQGCQRQVVAAADSSRNPRAGAQPWRFCGHRGVRLAVRTPPERQQSRSLAFASTGIAMSVARGRSRASAGSRRGPPCSERSSGGGCPLRAVLLWEHAVGVVAQEGDDLVAG